MEEIQWWELPPRVFSYPVLWRASALSVGSKTAVVYVWATATEYLFGYIRPTNMPVVASFLDDQLLYSWWGDPQNEEEWMEEIGDYDNRQKLAEESRRPAKEAQR